MKVKFLPQNLEVEATSTKSLLQIANENKIEIRSICKGVPSCAECRVYITEGAQNTLPPSKAELNLIGTSYYIDGRRLSCQVKCFGDVTVDLTEQVERQETQTKKIRGFRTSKHAETQAVFDTMLLDEKIVEDKVSDRNTSDSEEPGSSEVRPQQQPQQQRNQRQGKNQGGQRQQQAKGQNQNQGQGQGQSQGQSQRKSNNPNQQQRQGKSQNRNAGANQNQRPQGPKGERK